MNPHKILQFNEITKISQRVSDLEKQVLPFIYDMAELCKKPIDGKKGVAIAHCQFDKDNPLTFYVYANGDCVVNPVILSVKEKTKTFHSEGCLSFNHYDEIKVERYRIIKASYVLLQNMKLTYVKKNISELAAYVMQHEIDHFNLKTIYDGSGII